MADSDGIVSDDGVGRAIPKWQSGPVVAHESGDGLAPGSRHPAPSAPPKPDPRYTTSIDVSRLLIQWAIAAAVTGGFVLILRSNARNTSTNEPGGTGRNEPGKSVTQNKRIGILAQWSVGSMPTPNAFEQCRESREVGPTIYVPPEKAITANTVAVASQKQPESAAAPAYPPIWSQAHTLPQRPSTTFADRKRLAWPAIIGGTLVCVGLLVLAFVATAGREIWTMCALLPPQDGRVVVILTLAFLALHTVGPIASGASLLMHRRSSRQRVLLYAWVGFTITTFNLLTNPHVPPTSSIAEVAGLLFAFSVAWGLPLFLIVWFMRDTVRCEISAWV